MIYGSLNREDYLKYHATLAEPADVKFSKVAIGMWNFMKAWENWEPRTLSDNGKIICVCFMKLSGQGGAKVLFISNIFTPSDGRGKGAAREMLDQNIKEAVTKGATSIRLDCNKSALGFYDKLGMTYWGATISHSMFCDLPIDSSGVECFQESKNKTAEEILNAYPSKLREAKIKWINKKVKRNDEFGFNHPSRYEEFLLIFTRKMLPFID